MNRDVIFVVGFCSVLIYGLWWYIVRPEMGVGFADVNSPITILVKDGKFIPSTFRVPQGKQITLHFLREDQSDQASAIYFPQFQTAYRLPMNQKVEVVLPPLKSGEVTFNAQMNMFRGSFIVS